MILNTVMGMVVRVIMAYKLAVYLITLKGDKSNA